MEDINRVHIIFTTFLAAAAWQDLPLYVNINPIFAI